MADVDETVKAWTAGFFDGEGSFLIERTGAGGSTYQIVVAVVSTYKPVIDYVHSLWGGRYVTRPREYYQKQGIKAKGDAFILYFNRKDARFLILDLLPYLLVRQDEAQVVIRAIAAQERAIRANGLRGSSFVLESFYQELQTIRAGQVESGG